MRAARALVCVALCVPLCAQRSPRALPAQVCASTLCSPALAPASSHSHSPPLPVLPAPLPPPPPLSYKFKFDGLLGMDTEQETVFDTVARPAVESALDGYNATVFAYGQTGSGKTFTVTGGAER